MPLYENVFIARQDISGAQVDALADTFTQLVNDNGGEVKKREYWGLRNLAYRMRKNRKGHYVLMNLIGSPRSRGRTRANHADQRGCDPLHDDPRRRVGGRAFGYHAEPRQP